MTSFRVPENPVDSKEYQWGLAGMVWLGLVLALATILMMTVGVCIDSRKKLRMHDKKCKKIVKRVEKHQAELAE